MAEQPPTKTYRGNCHCKAYVYETTAPELKEVKSCNCSICTMKGNVYLFPESATFIKGDKSTLTKYTFGSNKFVHQFCPTCGTSVLIEALMDPTKPPTLALNIRTFQDLDLWSLERGVFDGASLGQAFEPPEFTGELPKAEVEGGKLYYGSCHCKAVKLAVNSAPFDSNYPGRLTECNCSSCSRIGAIWAYPKKEQVSLDGLENLTRYTFNSKIMAKVFCKTCGVFPCQLAEPLTLTPEELAAKPAESRKWLEGAQYIQPINLNCLFGIDRKALKIEQFDGRTKVPGEYVNP